MKNTTKHIVFTAMLSALLLSGKVILGFIPNVEVVTLIIIVSAFAFHPRVVITATLVFCTGEWLIYGFGYWVLAYYIYWPLLAIVSQHLKLVKNRLLRNISAVIMVAVFTALFGVLTTFIDAILISENIDFFTAFGIIYLRGLPFFVMHAVSNCVIVSLLFTPLSLALQRLKPKNSTALKTQIPAKKQRYVL